MDQTKLWAAIRNTDLSVRCAAMDNPAITDSQIDELTNPDVQPAVVRHSASALPYPRAVSGLNDPNPLVRAIAGADPATDRRAREVVAVLAAW